MLIEQIINLAFIFGLSIYSATREETSRANTLKLICFGALVVLAQFILNRIFSGGTIGVVRLATQDILLVREISWSVGLVVIGYVAILTGLLSLLKSLFSYEAPTTDENFEKDENAAKGSDGAQ